jgi:hypothetical protein
MFVQILFQCLALVVLTVLLSFAFGFFFVEFAGIAGSDNTGG